jgi:hypothetical protein
MVARTRSDWTAFVHQLPKELEDDASNRDVAFVTADAHACVVVCDGTTSGWDSGWWAWLLGHEMNAALRSKPDTDPAALLEGATASARQLWRRHQREVTDPTTRLFAAGSANRQPGAATLLALTVRAEEGSLQVSGVAVGDTYAVGLVPGRTGWRARRAAPSVQSFDTTPHVVFAEAPRSGDERSVHESFGWSLPFGAAVIVGTDALMHWAFRSADADHRTWTLLANLDDGRFRELIAGLRRSGDIENDDTTLVQLRRTSR